MFNKRKKLLKDYFISASIDLLGRSNGNSLCEKATLQLLFYLFLDGQIIEEAKIWGSCYNFNHNALWSFPRSGSHWVRFIVEYLSESPTHGYITNKRDVPIYLNTFPNEENPLAHVNPSNPFVIYKSHSAYTTTSASAIILLIRNYRTHLVYLGSYKDHRDIVPSTYWIYEAIAYLELIATYDRFDGNKIVIYYEDLLACPEREISRIRCFFDGSYEHYKTFMNNYDYYAELSKQGKNRNWLYDDEAVENLKNHRKKLAKQDITARKNVFQAFLASKRYQCVKPYLARYE